MSASITKSITIHASPEAVWQALTEPAQMAQWMAAPEIDLQIQTDWKTGSPVVMKGFHHLAFENKGSVLHFEPCKELRYNYLSSISRLPDKPENYTETGFTLVAENDYTTVLVNIRNFPTETIRQHINFYWQGTLVLLKKFVEAIPQHD